MHEGVLQNTKVNNNNNTSILLFFMIFRQHVTYTILVKLHLYQGYQLLIVSTVQSLEFIAML